MLTEYMISAKEADAAFNNLIASGIIKLHAYHHNYRRAKPKVTLIPMNNTHDYELAEAIFDHETIIYAGNASCSVQTKWKYYPNEILGEAGPTIGFTGSN